MSSAKGPNQGAGEATHTGSTSNKIKEAYHVVHGIGENVRGNMMNVFDISRNQSTADEEIIRKGKMEAQQGMSALRGTAAGAPNTARRVRNDNEGNLAQVAASGSPRDEQPEVGTTGIRHHRDDAATEFKPVSQGRKDYGDGPVPIDQANVPFYNQNKAFPAESNTIPQRGDEPHPLERQSDTMNSGATNLSRRDTDAKSGNSGGPFVRAG